MYDQSHVTSDDPADVEWAYNVVELANALAATKVPILLKKNGFGTHLYLGGAKVATLKAGTNTLMVPQHLIPASMMVVLRQHRTVLMLDRQDRYVAARAVFLADTRYSARLAMLEPKVRAQEAVLS